MVRGQPGGRLDVGSEEKVGRRPIPGFLVV